MKTVIFDENNAKQLGRTLVSDGILHLIMSGTGCEFTFTGRKLQIAIGCDADSLNEGKICNLPRVAVIADGKFVLKKVIESRRELITVADSSEIRTVRVKIIKLSEAAFSIADIYPAEISDDEIIAPVPPEPLKIEFIGDSITCGYGVDDGNIESPFSTCVENAMKSYAFLTAQALNADYSLFSASGYGIISGYTHDGTRNTLERIPPYYESFGFSYSTIDGTVSPHNISWDFSRFSPDIIVVNLGTNDNSFCKDSPDAQREFESAYMEFIETIRRHNPDAEIICALGIMETVLFPCIRSACSGLNDKKLHIFEFERQDGSLGYSSNWHPSEDTHIAAAEKLTDFIKHELNI